MTLYKQLSGYIAKGFGVLDTESANELKLFVSSLQNNDGGFSDRAGNSDLYYSLFAHFILKNTTGNSYQKKLRQFVKEKRKSKEKNLVDLCCLAIMNEEVAGNRLCSLKYLFLAMKYLFNQNYHGSNAYQYFLLLLTLDAFGFNTSVTRWFARRFYQNSVVIQGLPCPALAAQIVFKNQLGFDVQQECNLLISYFEENRGFKINSLAENADLLSTSVALIALKTSGCDIALQAPACLQLADDNYRGGAFLSGDGDENRDSEYTFYGLLTLGALAS